MSRAIPATTCWSTASTPGRPCAASAQGEIHEVGWFALDALPADTTPGTRQRLAEVLNGAERDPSGEAAIVGPPQ